jgi:hypothetical protein
MHSPSTDKCFEGHEWRPYELASSETMHGRVVRRATVCASHHGKPLLPLVSPRPFRRRVWSRRTTERTSSTGALVRMTLLGRGLQRGDDLLLAAQHARQQRPAVLELSLGPRSLDDLRRRGLRDSGRDMGM